MLGPTQIVALVYVCRPEPGGAISGLPIHILRKICIGSGSQSLFLRTAGIMMQLRLDARAPRKP